MGIAITIFGAVAIIFLLCALANFWKCGLDFIEITVLFLLFVLIFGHITITLNEFYREENMMIIEGDTIYCEDCGRDMIIATIREEAGEKIIHYHCRKCGSEVGDKVATEEEMDRLKHWVLD